MQMFSGMMLSQYTADMQIVEQRILSTPASIQSIPAAADQEDFVSMGMNTALKLSFKKKFLKKNTYNSIINHFNNSKLPTNIKKYFFTKDLNKILTFMVKDKKNNSNKINLILLKKIGSTVIDKRFSKLYLKSFLKKELI